MKGQIDVGTPEEYFAALDEPRRSEVVAVDALIRETVPELERYIGHGLIGYGRYHYKYASGREGEWCRIGLASNKQYISIYACSADASGYVAEQHADLLGKASVGKSCIRFKKLADLNVDVLRTVLRACAVSALGEVQA